MRVRAGHRPVICVGELYTDVVLAELDAPPGASREVEARLFQVAPGGGAAITAVALTRLGYPASIVSSAGDDAITRVAIERLKREGVDVRALRVFPGRAGNVTVAISVPRLWGWGTDARGGEARDRALVTFRGVGARAPVDELKRLLALLSTPATELGRATCHIHYAGGDPDDMVAVAEVGREQGATVSVDIGWELAFRHAKAVTKFLESGLLDVFFCNDEEARALTGEHSLQDAISVLGSLVNVAVVKTGERGAVAAEGAAHRGQYLHVPAPPCAAVDTTGAGDAFCGGFLYGYVRGWPISLCLELGVWVGSLSTERPGGIDGLPDLAGLAARCTKIASPVLVQRLLEELRT